MYMLNKIENQSFLARCHRSWLSLIFSKTYDIYALFSIKEFCCADGAGSRNKRAGSVTDFRATRATVFSQKTV